MTYAHTMTKYEFPSESRDLEKFGNSDSRAMIHWIPAFAGKLERAGDMLFPANPQRGELLSELCGKGFAAVAQDA